MFFFRTQVSMYKGWETKLHGKNLTRNADVNSGGLFLISMSTHHSEISEGTRFRALGEIYTF